MVCAVNMAERGNTWSTSVGIAAGWHDNEIHGTHLDSCTSKYIALLLPDARVVARNDLSPLTGSTQYQPQQSVVFSARKQTAFTSREMLVPCKHVLSLGNPVFFD
jgi:hypothetical protein